MGHEKSLSWKAAGQLLITVLPTLKASMGTRQSWPGLLHWSHTVLGLGCMKKKGLFLIVDYISSSLPPSFSFSSYCINKERVSTMAFLCNFTLFLLIFPWQSLPQSPQSPTCCFPLLKCFLFCFHVTYNSLFSHFSPFTFLNISSSPPMVLFQLPGPACPQRGWWHRETHEGSNTSLFSLSTTSVLGIKPRLTASILTTRAISLVSEKPFNFLQFHF